MNVLQARIARGAGQLRKRVAHPATVLAAIVVAWSGALCACTISVGGANGHATAWGLQHVGRTIGGDTVVVDRGVLGVDVRIRTVNDGVTVGYSQATVVFPPGTDRETPKLGLRWPLGYAWTDRDGRVLHELGFVFARIPEPDDVLLLHHRQIGLGGMLSPRCVGVFVGYGDRCYVEAPMGCDAVYTVQYESDSPFDAALTVSSGGH